MKYKITISDVAWSHLDDLYFYIAQNAGEPIAESFVGGLQKSFFTLASFPRLGKYRNSATIPDLHTIPYKDSTVIAYMVDDGEKTLTILGVFYGGRDYEGILDISDE